MEPRIIKGHLYRCKRNVIGGNHKYYYKAGKIYECEIESTHPSECTDSNGNIHLCGYITNEFGDKGHAWPYIPEYHKFCHDCWTDDFEDLGEKPAGMIITPYSVGDTVSWFCFDDYEIHKSKIISMEIEVVRDREPIIVYKTRIKLKGTMQEAGFTMDSIRAAQRNK